MRIDTNGLLTPPLSATAFLLSFWGPAAAHCGSPGHELVKDFLTRAVYQE